MLDDGLRQRRLEVIREHMDTEVTQEFDRALATFNGIGYSASLITQIGRGELLTAPGPAAP
jgi:hypothetical protein